MIRRFLFILVMTCCTASAQPVRIGGIINDYAEVLDITLCVNTIRVDDVSGFTVGDVVLLIQMQGATQDTNSGPSQGRLRSIGTTGRFERNVIASITAGTIPGSTGGDIVLRNRISQPFTPGNGVQLVRMPVYASAVVISPLTCRPWDGRLGGVLALQVRDTLYLEDDISVSGRGFRGGRARTGSGAIVDTIGTTDDTSGFVGSRGESVTKNALPFGTARSVNGGGGGGAILGGGQGGSHLGCGGRAYRPYNGTSGEPLSYDAGVNWLFMGGGGGSAFRNGGEAHGGDGGGIVVIDVPVLKGDGTHVISVSGGDGVSEPNGAGGGGGAGGAMLITAVSIVDVPTLLAYGGAGGAGGPDPYGNGGGGGGGVIRLGTINAFNLNPSSYAGGRSGRKIDSVRAGETGCDGSVFYNVTINGDTNAFRPVTLHLSPDTTVCIGSIVRLVASGGATTTWLGPDGPICDDCDSLTWQADSSVTLNAIVLFPGGCVDTASIRITVRDTPELHVVDPPPICLGDTVRLEAPTGFASYLWTTGAASRSIDVTVAGTYGVAATDAGGCTGTAIFTVRYREGDGLSFVDGDARRGEIVWYDMAPGERLCRTLTLRNSADTAILVTAPRFARGVDISSPLGQFPISVAPHGDAAIVVCAGGSMPGEYRDTCYVPAGCSELPLEMVAFISETRAFTRCNVEVTSDGERHVIVPIEDVGTSIELLAEGQEWSLYAMDGTGCASRSDASTLFSMASGVYALYTPKHVTLMLIH